VVVTLAADSATIAAWAAVAASTVGVIAALVAVWWQMRRQWLLNSAAMVTDLADRFTSDEWRGYRTHCSLVIQAHRRNEPVDLSEDFQILGLFEHVALLVRRGVLDDEMVWNKFGWYVTRYFLALTTAPNLIEANRDAEGDTTLWEEFEWLYQRMSEMYKNRGVDVEDPEQLDARLDELLRQELNLRRFRLASDEHAVTRASAEVDRFSGRDDDD
jgi:hypothetical protein